MNDILGKMTGLDKPNSGDLLVKMAPVVMGAQGKQKQSKNLDTGGLFDMLTKSVEPKERIKSSEAWSILFWTRTEMEM